MGDGFGIQGAVLYILSLYYKLFARVEYTDGGVKSRAISQQQLGSDGANGVPDSAMSNIDRTALDEFQITALLRRERYCRDSRQWQKLRNCYHPEPSKTKIEVAAFKGNIDGFMNVSQMTTPPGLKILHPIDPVDIEIQGSKAVAWSMDRTIARFDHKHNELELTTWCRTVSRLMKLGNAGWKICSWETVYNRDQIVAVDPSVTLTALEGVDKLRKSYRHFAWFVSLKGVKIPEDLPGDDKPDSVAQVFKKSQAWLNSEVQTSKLHTEGISKE
ncbi:MAG: hypothetical protein Q9181_000639 [Wetmoreana brouardii]